MYVCIYIAATLSMPLVPIAAAVRYAAADSNCGDSSNWVLRNRSPREP